MVFEILASLQPADWISAVGYVVGVLGGLFGFIYAHSTRLKERRQRALDSQVSRVDREMVAWGIDCIMTMSQAHILAATCGSGRPAGEIRIERDALQARLSGLVDAGRLYFINRSPDLIGTGRNYANRGFRPAILDALMLAHEELRFCSLNDPAELGSIADNIFGARRVFISELREEVDKLRNPYELAAMRTKDDDWGEIEKLVARFQERRGRRFWEEKPIPRTEILAEIKAGKRPAPAT